MPGSNTGTTEPVINYGTPQLWTPARIYTTYRIFLAALLLTVFVSTRNTMPLLGAHDPRLFLYTAIIYLLLSLIPPLLPRFYSARSQLWGVIPLTLDVMFLSLLIHASGGINSNLTVLLIVTVAAASIILPGRLGLLIAALSNLAMMFEQFYFSLGDINANPFHLTQSGVLGLSFFIVALITQQVAQRLASSELIAASQRKAISRLEALNQKVVERMLTGVLVFDNHYKVVLSNESARKLFTYSIDGRLLPEVLVHSYQSWQQHPEQHRPPIIPSSQSTPQEVGFATVNTTGGTLNIVFLEDHSRTLQQAQQLKLAGLGRMSATIAHEIRNPLSAINHAAELLQDGKSDPEDQRLVTIIQQHVQRVNGIIDTIMNLSRREASKAALLDANDVIQHATERWKEHGHPVEQLKLQLSKNPVKLYFDQGQLEQVLDNLLMNARIHAGENTIIELSSGHHEKTDLPWIKVRDHGPGVSDNARDKLFEPFFTTARQGNGLGLFVCRELCEANRARLDYQPANPGASFVITFAHPDRLPPNNK